MKKPRFSRRNPARFTRLPPSGSTRDETNAPQKSWQKDVNAGKGHV